MPTTEWLNKYEAIKDKLTCKDDLEAHFTEKVIGNMAVDVLDIGTRPFPHRQIFACDPLVELEDTLPFLQTIPAGTYPVKICVVPSEQYGDRYACVKVEVSQEKPVRYELGDGGQRGSGRGTGRGRVFWLWRRRRDGLCRGHPDPGDLQGILGQAFRRRPGHRPLQRPVLRSSGRKTPKPTPNIRGTAATGSTGQCRARTATCPSLPPAGGMVTILSTSGMTPRAKSAPCMCGSSTSKPATRSRRKEASDGMAKTGADSGLGKWCPGLR